MAPLPLNRRLTGLWAYGLGTSCMLFAGVLVAVFALTTQVSPAPWYHRQFALPLLGMILGNTMTGVSLGLHTLTTGLTREVAAVEYQILVMFLIAGGTAMGVVAAVLGGVFRLTDGRHRLRLDRLSG